MPREEKSKRKPADRAVERLRRRFERLARRLGETRWVLLGTIRPRWIPGRGGGPEKRLGPYWQWTFKERGTTVTVNLSAAQAKAFERAIREQRKVETLLAEMRLLSRQFLEASIPGVKRRNSKRKRALGA